MLVSTPSGEIELPRRHDWRRWVVFLAVFAVSAGASLGYVFSRVPEYRAASRIEIFPARTIGEGDQTRPPSLEDQPASFLTEVQTLTSRPVIEKALGQLGRTETVAELGTQPVEVAQELLAAKPVEHTDVVELSAEGPQRDLLWRLVNAVTDAYREQTAGRYEQRLSGNYDDVKDELENLRQQAVAKRKALDTFGAANNIVSAERDENSVLADIQNLSRSYSTSIEDLAKAQGHLQALKNVTGEGATLVSAKDDPTIAAMEQQLSTLRDQLTDLQRRYTPAYLALDSDATALERRIEGLERQIATQRTASQKTALAAAEEELEAAQAQVNRLRGELADNQKKAQKFATRLAQYKSMQEDFDHLENIERLTADRLSKMQATGRESAPRIEILERAAPSQIPIRPDYATNAAIAVTGSLALGIFAVWFVGFVGGAGPRREFAMPSLHLHPAVQALPLAQYADESPRLAANPAINLLPRSPSPRELEDDEIIALITNSTNSVALACVALLTGLSAGELLGLTWDQIDLEAGEIRSEGSSPRTIIIEEVFALLLRREKDLSRGTSTVLHDRSDAPWSMDELAHEIICAAYDAALQCPEEITPSALRHSYLVWLFRQGIRAGDVTRVAGLVPHEELTSYLQSFAGGSRASITEIDRVHPALRKLPLRGYEALKLPPGRAD